MKRILGHTALSLAVVLLACAVRADAAPSPRRFFQTQPTGRPPASTPTATLKLVGPGVAARPVAPIPLVPSRQVLLEWQVDHPELFSRFSVRTACVIEMTTGPFVMQPKQVFQSTMHQIMATPGQTEYAWRVTVAPAEKCRKGIYMWDIMAFDRQGALMKPVEAGGPLKNEQKLMLFQAK